MSKILIFIPKVVLAIIIVVVTTSGSKPHIASAKGQSIDPNTMLVGSNLLLDPGFEASYGSNQYWTQALGDTICISWDPACQVNGAGYHSGGSWGCFGCLGSNFDDIFQDVIFPRCGADLEFHLYIGEYFGPGQPQGRNNYFTALIDNTEVFRAYGSEVNSYQPYQKITIPVDAFNDGATHRVRFHSENLENFLWFNLDDVALVPDPACAEVAVSTAGTIRGTYGLPNGGSLRQSYSNVDSGPVKVVSKNGVPIIASMRVAYNNGSAWTDFSELMGLPIASLSTKYSFPAYDNIFFNSQLRFANVGNANTTVTVTVGGVVKGNYTLVPNQSWRVSYNGLSGGPVVVQSSGGVKIIASMRVAYFNSTISKWTSFSEMMGLPESQLNTSYLFPWYNNKDLNSQVRFGNVGTSPTNVTVTIGGVVKGTYTNLAPNSSLRFPLNTNDAPYADLDSGPVKVTSSGGVPIVASIRIAYNNGSAWTSFSELMGLPSNRLTNSYVFPWYNNLDLNSQLRFGNVGTSNTTVTVTIGGVFKGSYLLIPNESKRISYVGLDDGPVKVTSSGNIPIIASLRVAYNNGSAWTSFSELMGLPASQLSTSYLFPWYNSKDLNSQVRFGNP